MFGLVPFDKKRNQMQGSDNIFDIDRIFDNFFNGSMMPTLYNRQGLMKVDIRDEGDSFVLEAELPGVGKEDVNLEINDNRLTISVNQDEQSEDKQENYIRRERRAFSMARSFSIEGIKADAITAKMENGVLSLKMPKQEPAKPQGRKVDIA